MEEMLVPMLCVDLHILPESLMTLIYVKKEYGILFCYLIPYKSWWYTAINSINN